MLHSMIPVNLRATSEQGEASLLCYVIEMVVKVTQLLMSSLKQGIHIHFPEPLRLAIEFACCRTTPAFAF